MNPIYRWIAAGAGLLIAVFLVWYFQTIVFYILIAAVLSLMGKPLVDQLGRIRIRNWSPPKWLRAAVTLAAMFVTIIGLARIFFPIILEKFNQISSFGIEDLTAALAEPIAQIEHYVNNFLAEDQFSLREYIADILEPIVSGNTLENSIVAVTSWIINAAVAIFAITFITYFFLKEDSLFVNGLVLLFPHRYEEHIRRALDSSTRLLIRYFIGICIEMFIMATFITSAFLIIGFDFSTSLFIGVLSAILNVIPYLGPWIGAILGCIIALLTPVAGFSTGMLLLTIILVFATFQILDNFVLQPFIYSSSVKAHPLEIFLVILLAGYIAGIWGMLLAIPSYTVIRVFAKEFFNQYRVVQKLTEKI